MTVLASLVIPVYQQARYLPRTVPSWLGQDLDGDFEVLLIDNGSTDGGVEALPDHPRLRRLHESRRGAYAARNTGAGEATGEFLVFIDPDCVAPPGWLRRLLAPLREDRSVAAAQGPARSSGDDRWLHLLSLYELHREAAVYSSGDPRLYYAHTNNLAVRRTAFERVGPFDLRARGADTLLARRLVDQFGCAAMVHAPDAPVEHLEVDRSGVWMRKMFIYGRSRYDHATPGRARSLSGTERLSVWRSAVRAEGMSPIAAAELFAILGAGVVCWWAGCIAGLLRRSRPPSRGLTASSWTTGS